MHAFVAPPALFATLGVLSLMAAHLCATPGVI